MLIFETPIHSTIGFTVYSIYKFKLITVRNILLQ